MFVSRNADGTCYHVQVKPGEVHSDILLVGDPGRARQIGEFLNDVHVISENRGLVCLNGSYKNVPLTVATHGIGPASTAIVVQELLASVKPDEHVHLVRLGTSGSLQSYVNKGDVVVAKGAIRDETTTDKIAPKEVPATASLRVSLALLTAAKNYGFEYLSNLHYGLVHVKNELYFTEFPTESPLAETRRLTLSAYKRMGCLASEMEFSVLSLMAELAVAKKRASGDLHVGVDAGALLLAINDCHDEHGDDKPNLEHLDPKPSIEITLNALAMLRTWTTKETQQALAQTLATLTLG